MARTHRIRQLYSVLIIQAAMRGHSGTFHQAFDVEESRTARTCLNCQPSLQNTHG